MTAIGFALFVVGMVLAWIVDNFDAPDILEYAAGFGLLAGGALLVAGVTRWLWGVMP